jgi:amino acid transporter
VAALGQFIVALNFAEVTSHYPVAGSVFQWTKFLAHRAYSWFTGWVYLFAGILTVTAVVATLPLALIPSLNGLGWHSLGAGSSTTLLHTELAVALITLIVITVLNIYGVRLVALINNTGVVFEILGMFVFALILMAFHNHQGFKVVTNSAGFHVGPGTFLAATFMSLFVLSATQRPAGPVAASALGLHEGDRVQTEGAPLMLVERVAYARTGQPVEFARDLFRGDRTRIVMWTSELPDVL